MRTGVKNNGKSGLASEKPRFGFRKILVNPSSLVLFLLTPFSSQVNFPTSQYVRRVQSEQLPNHLSMLELTNQPLSREIML